MKTRKHREGGAPGQSIPASLRGLLDSFACCFTRPSHGTFVALTAGWILCQGRHSVSRVIEAALGLACTKHFSSLYRFFSQGHWSPDELGRVVFGLLLRLLPGEVEALIDDTLCRHRGPRIFGTAMHHDASLSTYGRGTKTGRAAFFSCGHCWVVLAVRVPLPWDRDRGIAIPVLFRLYRSKKHCDKRSYRKRTELAAEIVSLLESWIPCGYRLFLAGDGEYASRTLVRTLDARTTFIGPMVKDAALYAPAPRYSGKGRPRKKGRRLRSPMQLATAGSAWEKVTITAYRRRMKVLVKTRTCLWYTVAGTRLVRVVITRDPRGRAEDRAYFSTDPRMSPYQILERFARRWLIEVAFRDVKQHLGLEDPQNGWGRRRTRRRGKKKPGSQTRGNRGRTAVQHTAPLAFTAYTIVVLWFLREGDASREVRRRVERCPWYRSKTHPAFADMLVALRREIWTARLSQHPAEDQVTAKLQRLLPDALLAA